MKTNPTDCPICGNSLKNGFCGFCGYDGSADFLRCRTLRQTEPQDHFERWVYYARIAFQNGETAQLPSEGEAFRFPDAGVRVMPHRERALTALEDERKKLEYERYYLGFFAGKRRKAIDERLKELQKEKKRLEGGEKHE